MDCSHSAHAEDVHFTAATDEELFEQVKRHRDEYHTDMTDEQVREAIAQNAYNE